MVGSEGTLGFIAAVTYRTVPEYADKSSALLLFPSLDEACQAVIRLKSSPVSAVELIDRASLRSIENRPGMPEGIKGLDAGATAVAGYQAFVYVLQKHHALRQTAFQSLELLHSAACDPP